MTRTVMIAALIAATLAAARADERRDVPANEARMRPDTDLAWGEGDGAEIGALLADGLTREEAVRIALTHNSQLQAAFGELGIARSDLEQAGLYSNPAVEAVIRWPDEHDPEVEIEAAWNIADLWRVPLRRRVARTRADQITMSVLAELLNTAADARMAWDAAVAARSAAAETEAVRDAARELLARMQERLDYGFGEELAIQRMVAEVAEVEVELATAQAGEGIAIARLRRALGLPADASVEPAGELPGAPANLPSPADLADLALSTRPEIRAADLGVRAATVDRRLQRRSTWRHVELGPAYAREPEGDELWGFALAVDLPVFDSNRAQRRRTNAQLRVAEDRALAVRAMVREEVEVAAERLELAARREATMRETVIPARERAHQFARTHQMQMELSMLPVIETRRELAAARLMHVEARRQVAEALVELEFAVGGRLP